MSRIVRQPNRSYRSLTFNEYRRGPWGEEVMAHVRGAVRPDADPIFNEIAHQAAINGITRRRYQNQKARDPNIRPWISFTVVPYDLRHSFCTMCRDAEVEINTCIKWMGHSDATMILSVYDEVTHTREESEVEKLMKISIS